MLRACVKGPEPLLIVGLSDGNVQRLQAGQPIKADFRSFGLDMPGGLTIFHGQTEAKMEAMLRKHGLIDEHTERCGGPLLEAEVSIRANFKKVLILTVGLPRSGKSTWAKQQPWPIVNPDSIRLAIHGQAFLGSAEPFVWATAKAMVSALFLAGHDTIVLDATSVTRQRRDEWKSKQWGLFMKEIGTDAAICRERAIASSRPDLLPVIERMAAQWEPLGVDEKRWPF